MNLDCSTRDGRSKPEDSHSVDFGTVAPSWSHVRGGEAGNGHHRVQGEE